MAENKLSLNLTNEVAAGNYANLAVITHSPSEFIIDFARIMPGQQQTPVTSRIIMTAEHAKRLLMALEDNLAKYEQQYGKITLHNNVSQVPNMPMSYGSGQA